MHNDEKKLKQDNLSNKRENSFIKHTDDNMTQ